MVLLGTLLSEPLSGAAHGAAPPPWMHAAAVEQGATQHADTALCISGEFRMKGGFLDDGEEISRYFNLADGKTDVFVFAQWATTSKNQRNEVATPKAEQSAPQKRCLEKLSPWTKMWGEYHWPSPSEPGVTEAVTHPWQPGTLIGQLFRKQRLAPTVRACGDWNGTAIGTDRRCITGTRGLPQFWSMSQCFRMVQQYEQLTGAKPYRWLIRARSDSKFAASRGHPMHPRGQWEELMPAGTILVNTWHTNSLSDPETCRADATTGAIHKHFGCLRSGFPWCSRWWFNDTVGMDQKLALREEFSIPDGFAVPYETKRELMRHDLDLQAAPELAAAVGPGSSEQRAKEKAATEARSALQKAADKAYVEGDHDRSSALQTQAEEMSQLAFRLSKANQLAMPIEEILAADQPPLEQLQQTHRPSDKFAMGRRQDMTVYFSTIASYVFGGGGEFHAARYLFSSCCCDLLNTAEGRLCYHLTGHGTKFALMYPETNSSRHSDFF
jgi:hypothetical protein